MPTTTSPAKDESRWTDEGGSNQHYRKTDEPTWSGFAPREERTWQRFEATYGKGFAKSVKACGKKDQP